MIGPRRVERVSRAYWSGFLLVRGNTVAPCLQCSEWTETLLSRRACFYADEICERPWTDATNGRMDETGPSLSSPLLQLPRRYLLVSLISFRLPSSPAENHPPLFFYGENSIRPLSFSLSLSIISTPLRFLCRSFSSPPLPVVDNSTSHLVLLSRSNIPRLFSLLVFFSIFHISLFYFRLHFSVLLFLPSSSCRSFRVLHILLAWHNIFLLLRLSSLFVVQSFVAHCYQLTPTLGSPFNVPTLFQKAAPVSAFCSRVSRTRKEERRRVKITRARARARDIKRR